MRSFVILILLLFASMAQSAPTTEFYVAANGSDTNPGTKGKPFATLERARDAVRVAKRDGGFSSSPLTVWIRGGIYWIDKTFTLTAEDSGTAYAPIAYRAFEGETVRLAGGRRIADFRPVTDPAALSRLADVARGKVLQADLKAIGITDYGELTPRGFGRPTTPSGLELFFDNKPMTLARWPNDDWMKIADVPAGPQGGKFTYDGDRPSRWAAEDDIWIHGYWTWDWAETYEKVKSIDLQAKEIATEPPHGVYGYKKGARWYALNLLSELTQPGEWYLDRKTGVLYFWPPEPIGKSEAWVSLLESPMITMTDTSYVTIQGVTIECTRGHGVVITGGKQDRVAGCALRNIGNVAVVIGDSAANYANALYNNTVLDRRAGSGNGVVGCDIAHCGEGGVILGGGDRPRLIPGGNFVENCDISDFSYWVRTYRPGIAIDGVGNRIAHNYIHDAPHCAILLHGNEHLIEFNDIHRVCMETSDAGGFYLGRDFTERGNVVRYNYFRELGNGDVRAVYLDDDASDVRVYGNVLYKAGMGVCIGGGRDNVVTNNIFAGCRPSVSVDNRGENWAKSHVDGLMKQRLEAVNFTQPPWSERYPELLSLYEDNPGAPKYNVIERNVSFGGKWLSIYKDTDPSISIKDNLVDLDPGFVDLSGGDLRLRDDSPAWKLGFKRIPMERIGLQVDEYRANVGEGVGLPPRPLTGEGVQLPPQHPGKKIKKLGTIVCDLVEATPVVFKGKLYRFEYVRDQYYKPNLGKPSYFRFVDVKTGEPTPAFAQGYHLGSAFVDGDTAYAFGVNIWDGEKVEVFWSKDLQSWESKTALNLPGWGIFNTSVCKGRDGYIMAFEIGRPPEETGVPFTIRFAESKDLREWRLTPSECIYSKERYTACPAIRYVEGWYYMIYLEAYPGPAYNPCIVRSKDLVKWESSPQNPIMHYSIEDKLIANPKLSQEERERIAGAVDINNSDVDFCEFEGKTIIVYSWGNQQGIEHLAEAVYDGPESEFLKSFFAE